MLNAHDIDLIRRDDKLKHLRVVLDASLFTPLIAQQSGQEDISNARLTYLRYKPGMNCIAGYEYELDGCAHFAYTKIFSDSQQEKREKFTALTKAGIDDTIAFSFYPVDSKLKALRKLADPKHEAKFVERIFSDRADLWDGKLQLIRYKPERRLVSRLVVDDQTAAVVKLHTRHGYTRLKASNKSFKSRENLHVARRIGHSDRHCVLAFEWLHGNLLSDILRPAQLAPATMLSVGNALGHIHAQRSDRLPVQNNEALADQIMAVADQVAYLCPGLQKRITSLSKEIGNQLLNISRFYSATHGDFYAKQVLVQFDGIGVLDFDEAAFADPMSDLGNFFAHLERDGYRYNIQPGYIRDIQQGLIEGYHATGQPIDRRRINLFFAANLFKLLPHPFRFREENWPVQTALLLDSIYDGLQAANKTTHLLSIPSNQNGSLSQSHAERKDARLPFLEVALDRESAQTHITNALAPHYPGHKNLTLHSTSLMRHKPGRRCMIEYTLLLEDQAGKRKRLQVLGKARKKKTDRSTFELTQTLWQTLFNEHAGDGLLVPEPLGFVDPFNMWLQQKVEGYTATSYMAEPMGPIMCENISRALYKLHTKGPQTVRTHTIEDELGILAKRLEQVAALHPQWRRRIEAIMSAAHDLAGQLPNTTPIPIHRDFYPDNVLIGEKGVYLLDLDLYSMGDPALDPGNFIGHVIEESIRLHGDPYKFAPCLQAFEQTYLDLAGEHLKPAIDTYTTLTLARHIQISTLFESRRKFTSDIIELCEQRLTNHSVLQSAA